MGEPLFPSMSQTINAFRFVRFILNTFFWPSAPWFSIFQVSRHAVICYPMYLNLIVCSRDTHLWFCCCLFSLEQQEVCDCRPCAMNNWSPPDPWCTTLKVLISTLLLKKYCHWFFFANWWQGLCDSTVEHHEGAENKRCSSEAEWKNGGARGEGVKQIHWSGVEDVDIERSHSSGKWNTLDAICLVLSLGYFEFKRIRGVHRSTNTSPVYITLRLHKKNMESTSFLKDSLLTSP